MAKLSFLGQGELILGTVSVNPASIANAAIGETTVSISDATVGDIVVMVPPAAGLTAGIGVVGAHVSASGTVKLRLVNNSGGAVDEAAATWSYILIRA